MRHAGACTWLCGLSSHVAAQPRPHQIGIRPGNLSTRALLLAVIAAWERCGPRCQCVRCTSAPVRILAQQWSLHAYPQNCASTPESKGSVVRLVVVQDRDYHSAACGHSTGLPDRSVRALVSCSVSLKSRGVQRRDSAPGLSSLTALAGRSVDRHG